MNIIILGAGQVGSSVASELAKEYSNEITVVDIDQAILNEYRDKLAAAQVAQRELPAFPEDLLTPSLHNTWPDTAEAVVGNWIGLDALGEPEFGLQVFIDEKPDYYEFANETKDMTGAEVFAKFTSS